MRPAGPDATVILVSESESLHAMVFVRLADTSPVRFQRFLQRTPGIVAAWQVAGDTDLVVQLDCLDVAELGRVLAAMRVDGGAIRTNAHLVLRQVDLATRLPGARCDTAARRPRRGLATGPGR
ncbi:Lrp/AsnC ligand binding domain-containing protein [Dactylosporangium sp. AC04546]|uniref:Lrp/AsnC ligand binding domain-containing protein n=1 Tax=Dactylosporangium sp. AC04546 TaxID=2862460 RepID=UPI001EDD4E99|nr:Lrp/AsnC ligand binding domain-containing protein [Dactylosporangium sp. AC04546]WVK78844.1 Lrp/AsnC ligand binding domain-containing protein [Dactylosporangium sp. AC04546]